MDVHVVKDAVQRLRAQGQRATVRAIHTLTGGSLRDVHHLLKEVLPDSPELSEEALPALVTADELTTSAAGAAAEATWQTLTQELQQLTTHLQALLTAREHARADMRADVDARTRYFSIGDEQRTVEARLDAVREELEGLRPLVGAYRESQMKKAWETAVADAAALDTQARQAYQACGPDQGERRRVATVWWRHLTALIAHIRAVQADYNAGRLPGMGAIGRVLSEPVSIAAFEQTLQEAALPCPREDATLAWVALRFVSKSYSGGWVRLQTGDVVLTSPTEAARLLGDYPSEFQAAGDEQPPAQRGYTGMTPHVAGPGVP